ncbi:MAG: hypothetical protein H0X13_09780 [Ramlibacter sp.]|nr:hypothetical protein [Ramlibacter sp.]
MKEVHRYEVPDALKQRIDGLVTEVLDDCPGESEYRYISRLADVDLGGIAEPFGAESRDRPALHVVNLPTFESVQKSKILALLLGETIGKCVAYSDYNQSYITDIRATRLSREASAGTELLSPHSDLAFADDECRPQYLVLVAHKADGEEVKTLLARVHRGRVVGRGVPCPCRRHRL